MVRLFSQTPEPLTMWSADTGAGGGAGLETEHDDDGEIAGDQDGTGDNAGEVRMSQAELNRLIQREKRRAAEAERRRLQEEADREKLSTEERLKAEKAEAEARAQEIQAAANARIIAAEARVQAVALGVRPERVAYAIRLADLSGVTMNEDGEPDTESIKTAINAVLKDLPELRGQTADVGGRGSNPPGGGKPPMRNPWAAETWNLTEQGKLIRENPALAEQLRKAAKGK